MFKHLFALFLYCFYGSLAASELNKVEILQSSQQAIYKSKLECQRPLSTDSFQNCWLTLSHGGKLIKNAEIFISGGMPEHEHGLPTSPKIVWSEDKSAHLIQGLKFSMPGQWSLNFKVNAKDDALKDQISILIKVDRG